VALTLFGFHGRPHDFAVTKADLPLEECVFLLDFSRPLGKHRWFGKYNLKTWRCSHYNPCP
jgi:hypothetical protein